MGRHADPDPRHFWGSLAVASVRASAALALVVGVFVVLSSFGPVVEDGPVMLGTPEPEDLGEQPSPEPPAAPAPDTTPDADPAPGAQHESASPPADNDAGSPEAVIAAAPPPQETTVQVLDGIGGSPRLPLLVAALEDLGYAVVATGPAGVNYAVTTVLFTEGYEDAARALQARDSRIVERRPNPGVSTDIHLHVVLGADWEP